MRSIVSKLMIATVLLLGAQFTAPRANAVDIGNSIGIGVSLDTTYQYISDGEVGEGIDERGLYPEHNDFSIDAFTLSLEKVPTVGEGVMDQVGFRADVLFGEQAERLGFGFNSDGDGAVSPYQAYINVLIPGAGSGLNVYAGQFTTLAGWELIEAKDNTNITRSLLFYRIPFAHSGVRATFSAGSLDFALGLSNDWDALDDEDDGKTFEGQIALNLPNDGWLGVTGYFGDTDGDTRTLVTVVGTMTLMEKVTLIADFEYTSHDYGGDRWGFAGYAIVSLADSMSLALRGEYVDDEEIRNYDDDGNFTGLAGVKLYEFTSTLILTPFESVGNFETRLEYRYDKADGDDAYFAGGDDQHGFAVQLLYWLDV
ncbi:MAG: outer membrane beta-barrel protein [Candidatus Dadabacteria bacterium]|nr:outer membrane beta-barrel protein [Candidatus Dadabacteria bacterium]MYC40648.1 outer membrane beta-barrel protein [Candidatus Dadabacteria bacterium]MYH40129.1 outer membrane beta-barrel protein [Candidatus Dadabacteria bacterium]